MVKGDMSTVALALVVVCLGLISTAGAGRTHELFAQSTFHDETTQPTTVSSEKVAGVAAEPLDNVADYHPEKTSTTTTTTPAQSTLSEPQEAQPVRTDPGTIHDPESARDQATANSVSIPQEQQQPIYRDYRGTTPFQGDFRADARPWWFNPQYDNYGNYIQGRNPQVDTEEPLTPAIPTVPSVPNFETRYPMGYPGQNMGPRSYYSQPSNGAQYSAMAQQPHQSIGEVPYEMARGGCPTQYWISNTQRWPAFFNVKTTVGDALGTAASKVFGQTTLLQALLNTRPDGYSTLLRTACAAILNSYSRSHYKFSHVDVIESFAKALSSSKSAAEQAAAFEEANVSSYVEQYNACF